MSSLVKVRQINLEQGSPTVEQALRNMINHLGTCKRQGLKGVILIHGYGSSGTGGKIRPAVRAKLKERSLSGIVRQFCGGEEWIDKKKEMLAVCSQLKDYETTIAGNPGVTIVILR